MTSPFPPDPLNPVRELLAQNELDFAIEQLRSMLAQSDRDLRNEALAQAGRLAELRRQERRGQLSTADAAVQRNMLRQGLLELVDEIGKKRAARALAELPIRVDLPAPASVALEKIIGTNNLKSIAWLQTGIDAARSVCRVVTPGGLGSGFLMEDSLLITNQHVIANADEAVRSHIELGFEEDQQGRLREPARFRLVPDKLLVVNQALDYCIVKVAATSHNITAADPGHNLAEWGGLTIENVSIPGPGEHVTIIQHPYGGPKQIAITANQVVNLFDCRLQYTTDTLPGSSGAPVFNDKWRVVALHHAGGNLVSNSRGDRMFANEGILLRDILIDFQRRSAGAPPVRIEIHGRICGLPSQDARRELLDVLDDSRDDGPRLYQVWFGTNREPVDSGDYSKGFSSRPSHTVHHGTCTVAVPKSHRFGSVGSSFFGRLLTWTDDRLKLRDIRGFDAPVFWSALRVELTGWSPDERQALVYLHGYNTTLEEAAIRAAQIGFDLKAPGVTALFSWPSRGTFDAYPADEASVEDSEPAITEFLIRLARDTGAQRVNVIAHSMGNRGLLRAVQRIERDAATAGVRFGQVLLAAPDVSVRLFHDLARVYPRLSNRTTLYISPADRAVAASSWLHRGDRVGFSPPITVVEGIDTVVVPGFNLLDLGHGYFAEAGAVLHDMFDLLHGNLAPDRRQRLERQLTDSGLSYWTCRS